MARKVETLGSALSGKRLNCSLHQPELYLSVILCSGHPHPIHTIHPLTPWRSGSSPSPSTSTSAQLHPPATPLHTTYLHTPIPKAQTTANTECIHLAFHSNVPSWSSPVLVVLEPRGQGRLNADDFFPTFSTSAISRRVSRRTMNPIRQKTLLGAALG